ncbi:MAG: 3-isopropylmalate dehydratase [Burkholderiaceae bacterium]|nr:3-isopropylmalate dehydratase [Burkholderiaceae bacterium]
MPQSTGRVWKLGADIDTDALAPGRWMKLALPELAAHCLEAVRAEFAREVRAGDVIAAGPNFGIGSSREQAAAALKHLGIAAVLAPSFAGIFYRNAINLGLPVLTCRDAERLADGERIALDLRQGIVTRADGSTLACEPLPPFLWDIVAAGGLLPSLKQRFASKGVKAS